MKHWSLIAGAAMLTALPAAPETFSSTPSASPVMAGGSKVTVAEPFVRLPALGTSTPLDPTSLAGYGSSSSMWPGTVSETLGSWGWKSCTMPSAP